MFFGKPPEKNYIRSVCPGCEPNAKAPYFLSRCFEHATRLPISAHEGAGGDVMPSQNILRGNA